MEYQADRRISNGGTLLYETYMDLVVTLYTYIQIHQCIYYIIPHWVCPDISLLNCLRISATYAVHMSGPPLNPQKIRITLCTLTWLTRAGEKVLDTRAGEVLDLTSAPMWVHSQGFPPSHTHGPQNSMFLKYSVLRRRDNVECLGLVP